MGVQSSPFCISGTGKQVRDLLHISCAREPMNAIVGILEDRAMKTISVVTPCFNEEANVLEVCERVRAVFVPLTQYRYEHIFIDNASRDNTLAILKHIAREDPRVKIIANARNFGHLRSPMHGMFQAGGDAVILLFSDLQDPPEMLTEMIAHWSLFLKARRSTSPAGPLARAPARRWKDLLPPRPGPAS